MAIFLPLADFFTRNGRDPSLIRLDPRPQFPKIYPHMLTVGRSLRCFDDRDQSVQVALVGAALFMDAFRNAVDQLAHVELETSVLHEVRDQRGVKFPRFMDALLICSAIGGAFSTNSKAASAV